MVTKRVRLLLSKISIRLSQVNHLRQRVPALVRRAGLLLLRRPALPPHLGPLLLERIRLGRGQRYLLYKLEKYNER